MKTLSIVAVLLLAVPVFSSTTPQRFGGCGIDLACHCCRASLSWCCDGSQDGGQPTQPDDGDGQPDDLEPVQPDDPAEPAPGPDPYVPIPAGETSDAD